MLSLKCSEQELKDVVISCVSFGEVCRKLHIPSNGAYFSALRESINKLGLSIDHFVKYKSPQIRQRIKKICPVCKKEFTIILYNDKKRHKRVCSKSCSNTYFRSGNNHPNWKEPDQRASKAGLYRGICFSIHSKQCILCKWDISVDVHHIDENEDNNTKDNLVPLCPNHHRMIHMKKHKKTIQEKIKKAIDLMTKAKQGVVRR
jgi:DNA-directed RNA polymerase subunit F